MGCFDRRLGRVLTFAIVAVWVVTLAFADTAVTPAMHCQRGHMPCCPQSGNGESCSTARCAEQVPQKVESQRIQEKEVEAQAAVPVLRKEAANSAAPEPIEELTPGLRYQASVFRLKDDLRI